MDGTDSTDLPMFPLGTVLMPGALLPLQVFEPRYLRLLDRVMAHEPHEFGVVLIERGSEVGGDDVRTDVGCVARVVRAAPSGGGRWSLVARGHRRLRVTQWLPDAPHPIARVVDWPDESERDGSTPGAVDVDAVVARTRRALALCAELGDSAAPATVEISRDPDVSTFELAALAPVGPHDRQRLLAAPGRDARLTLLGDMLDDTIALLSARIGAVGD
jgi:uncharacterized protein